MSAGVTSSLNLLKGQGWQQGVVSVWTPVVGLYRLGGGDWACGTLPHCPTQLLLGWGWQDTCAAQGLGVNTPLRCTRPFHPSSRLFQALCRCREAPLPLPHLGPVAKFFFPATRARNLHFCVKQKLRFCFAWLQERWLLVWALGA